MREANHWHGMSLSPTLMHFSTSITAGAAADHAVAVKSANMPILRLPTFLCHLLNWKFGSRYARVIELTQEIGRHTSAVTGDPLETNHPYQCLHHHLAGKCSLFYGTIIIIVIINSVCTAALHSIILTQTTWTASTHIGCQHMAYTTIMSFGFSLTGLFFYVYDGLGWVPEKSLNGETFGNSRSGILHTERPPWSQTDNVTVLWAQHNFSTTSRNNSIRIFNKKNCAKCALKCTLKQETWPQIKLLLCLS